MLQEPEFWADIFSQSRFRRKAIERAARAINLRVDLIFDDPPKVLRPLLQILANRKSRRVLNDGLGGNDVPQEIASKLMKHHIDLICALPGIDVDLSSDFLFGNTITRSINVPVNRLQFADWLRTARMD